MKSLKLLTSTLILGAVLTACSSDSDSGNFKPKNEWQEKAFELVKDEEKNAQFLSYEEIKAKYNIPANAKICKAEVHIGTPTPGIKGMIFPIAFTDNIEDYDNFKNGKYKDFYIPIFYINKYKIDGKDIVEERAQILAYNKILGLFSTSMLLPKIDPKSIDPKTCE
ncbi:hypothetical protein CQA38_08720 [Campylobacter sp. MIT 12-5580]|uniref:hypothetical protein n=1 Tax=Campylobacter sp. MIT 12-5580 TaxID=2040651 RepID=UPI0010FA58E4|nr:hypothetical protein [Campylobacter sp. MIT 12-5580]TKX28213.1 hypothetical protein CQA38_08720 [Campylobacter sp. MIT 12-5580]